jgi:hypothetical protein
MSLLTCESSTAAADELGELVDYFTQLAHLSGAFLDALPIERTPQPLAYALGALAPAIEQMKPAGLARLRGLSRPAAVVADRVGPGTGLNTVGMLTDRFTILLIKEWSLRHKAGANPAKADELFRVQTRDIIAALAQAQPGSSALNSKITSIKSAVTAADWPEAFWGLLTTNLLLWESQEMLYIRDISQAPPEELRDYITWFSRGNIRRNVFIEFCEQRYWLMAPVADVASDPS